MTIIILADILAIAIVALVAFRQGPDRRAQRIGWARGLLIAGLIPLGLQAAILLLFGAGEMASGDLSGAGHLVSLAATVLLALLAWKRPIEGGVALLIVGTATSVQFSDATANMIMAAPQIVSGALFLVGGIAGWRATGREA